MTKKNPSKKIFHHVARDKRWVVKNVTVLVAVFPFQRLILNFYSLQFFEDFVFICCKISIVFRVFFSIIHFFNFFSIVAFRCRIRSCVLTNCDYLMDIYFDVLFEVSMCTYQRQFVEVCFFWFTKFMFFLTLQQLLLVAGVPSKNVGLWLQNFFWVPQVVLWRIESPK